MQQEPDPAQRSRENMLTVSLVLVAGGLMLFFLWLISLGIVGNLLAAGTVFIIIACLHYLVWGKSFTEQVAHEKEALRRKENLDPPEPPQVWPIEESSQAIRDLSRGQAFKKEDE